MLSLSLAVARFAESAAATGIAIARLELKVPELWGLTVALYPNTRYC